MDATDRGTLHAVSTCSRVHAAGADLEGSSPFITEHMLDLMRKRMALSDYRQSSVLGSSTKVDIHRFIIVAPWYELTTLLMRILIYALGRSGSARRDLPGQPSHSSLYFHRR